MKEFTSHLRILFQEKAAKGVDKANKWLHSLVHTLRRGCGEDVSTELTEDQRAQVEACFGLVSKAIADDGVVTKAELVKVQGADFKLFERIDADTTGEVTLAKWALT